MTHKDDLFELVGSITKATQEAYQIGREVKALTEIETEILVRQGILEYYSSQPDLILTMDVIEGLVAAVVRNLAQVRGK